MNTKLPMLIALLVSAPVFADPSCEAIAIPEAGPGQKCEKIWTSPGSKYVVAQVKGGLQGTQVVVQHTYLLVYQVDKGALKELKRIELQSTERSSKGTVTLKDCEPIVPEFGNQSRFEIELKCQGRASVETVQVPSR